MPTQPKTRYTYTDLERFPQDNLRREIIDGELIVTAAPAIRHQSVVAFLLTELVLYARDHGGVALPAPTDVFFSDVNVVEPDVVFLTAQNVGRAEKNFIRSAPDVVIEVSSPTTRRLEVVRKRDLYERFAVPEYWYVDLEADRVEVYQLEAGRYGHPQLRTRGDRLVSVRLPGFAADVDELLGPPEDEPPSGERPAGRAGV